MSTAVLKMPTAQVREHTFWVSLCHGGHDLLIARRLDEALSNLIAEEFNVTIPVKFEGRLSLELGESVQVEAGETGRGSPDAGKRLWKRWPSMRP